MWNEEGKEVKNKGKKVERKGRKKAINIFLWDFRMNQQWDFCICYISTARIISVVGSVTLPLALFIMWCLHLPLLQAACLAEESSSERGKPSWVNCLWVSALLWHPQAWSHLSIMGNVFVTSWWKLLPSSCINIDFDRLLKKREWWRLLRVI